MLILWTYVYSNYYVLCREFVNLVDDYVLLFYYYVLLFIIYDVFLFMCKCCHLQCDVVYAQMLLFTM